MWYLVAFLIGCALGYWSYVRGWSIPQLIVGAIFVGFCVAFVERMLQ